MQHYPIFNNVFLAFFLNLPYLDKYTVLFYNFSKFDKEKANQINSIVEKLMKELQEVVIGGGLLSDFEEEQIDK